MPDWMPLISALQHDMIGVRPHQDAPMPTNSTGITNHVNTGIATKFARILIGCQAYVCHNSTGKINTDKKMHCHQPGLPVSHKRPKVSRYDNWPPKLCNTPGSSNKPPNNATPQASTAYKRSHPNSRQACVNANNTARTNDWTPPANSSNTNKSTWTINNDRSRVMPIHRPNLRHNT